MPKLMHVRPSRQSLSTSWRLLLEARPSAPAPGTCDHPHATHSTYKCARAPLIALGRRCAAKRTIQRGAGHCRNASGTCRADGLANYSFSGFSRERGNGSRRYEPRVLPPRGASPLS